MDAIKHAVVKGMKIGIQNKGSEDNFTSITHGDHFILVDGAVRIRGYDDSSEPSMEDTIPRGSS